ncbi:MAG: hypothetical protein OXF84_05255 [Bacteroidetes bacterium]|nr:hypothetical protein [Bacteroidota bacterium]
MKPLHKLDRNIWPYIPRDISPSAIALIGLITGYRKVTGKHLSLGMDEFTGWVIDQPAHIREVLTGLFQLLDLI